MEVQKTTVKVIEKLLIMSYDLLSIGDNWHYRIILLI